MKHFKTLIEIMRRDWDKASADPTFVNDSRFASADYRDSKKKLFFRLAEKARIFVLEPEDDVYRDSNNKLIEHTFHGDFHELDLPFQTCVFEVAGGQLYSTPKFHTLCLLVHENQPKHYEFFSLEYSDETESLHVGCWYENEDLPENVKSVTEILRRFTLARIAAGSLGTEKTKERIKLGKSKEKRVLEIKNIIRVFPRKTAQAKPLYGGKVDFSHRFEVMGHWRKIAGIGKDRSGDYCIKDYTWVRPHEKGPENLPLIKKTRIIEATHDRRRL